MSAEGLGDMPEGLGEGGFTPRVYKLEKGLLVQPPQLRLLAQYIPPSPSPHASTCPSVGP